MLKSIIKTTSVIFFILIAFAAISLVYMSIRKASTENEHVSWIGMQTTTIHGNDFIIGSTRSQYTIVFMFNPDCDLCLFELEDVIKAHDSFSEKEVNFISFAGIDLLEELHLDYKINTFNHIQLLNIKPDKLPVGMIDYPSPSVLVYNKLGSIILEHKGYCPPETLIIKIRDNENR